MTVNPAYVIVGHIVRPHGVRGALRVAPDTDFPERWADLREAVLLSDNRRTTVHVAWARPHGTAVLVKLVGIDSATQAERWRGAALAVPRIRATELPPGRHYVFDIIGLRVITEAGEDLGTVTDILRTGSNDVYVVRREDREYLIPAISSVVLAIEPTAGRVVIRPLPGLWE